MSALDADVYSGRIRWLRDGIISLLLFLLLLEWLRPLPELADITEVYLIYPFVAAIALFVATDYARIPGWAGWPLKIAACLFVTGYMFSFHRIPGLFWWIRYAGLLVQDANAAWNGDFGEISAETRTLLFLLGWALIISVIQALMIQRQHGLWFVAATLVYLLLLEQFFDADTGNGIVRTCLMGLALLPMLNLPRVERRFAIRGRKEGWPWPWLAASALLVAVCIGAGWYGAGVKSKEVRPIDWSSLSGWTSFFAGKADERADDRQAFPANYAATGYGEDDSRLGGPLRPNDTIVFTAWTSRITYWRGDSRSYYDGKGWSADSADASLREPDWGDNAVHPSSRETDPEGNIANPSSPAAAPGQAGISPDAAIVQEVRLTETAPADILFVGGPIRKLETLVATSGEALPAETVRWNPVTGKYSLSGQGDQLASYRAIVADQPWWDEAAGRSKNAAAQADASASPESLPPSEEADAQGQRLEEQVQSGSGQAAMRDDGSVRQQRGLQDDALSGGSAAPQQAGAALPEQVRQRYLQLPDELPQRVKDLALRIAGGAEDPYERALLLQSYLRTHYAYSLDKPTVPQENEDFVDHFLFADKLGYCDHFSTAMAVMLRAVGIPARWVKGYAPGEADAAESGSPGDAGANPDPARGDAAGRADAAAAALAAPSTRGSERLLHVTVRNRDAHSWVEAYIPGAGWVAFEPTPGFAPPDAGAPAALQAAAQPQPKAPAPSPLRQLARQAAEASVAAARAGWRWASAALLLLAPPLWAARRWRAEIAFRLAARGFGRGRDPEQQLRVFERLWRRVFRRLGGKPPQQTLREYIGALPNIDAVQRAALIAFAQAYESLRYDRRRLQSMSRRHIAELWRGIVKGAPAAKREEQSRAEPPRKRNDFLDADI